MQRITSYGVVLEPLQEKHLEMVRNWRNNKEVSKNMEYQDYITPENHQKWFMQVQTNNDYYFVISVAETPIGVAHLNLFNNSLSTAHAGLYVAEKQMRGTGIALGASLTLLDFAFLSLELCEVFAKTHQNNSEAIAYNQFLGFENVDMNTNGFYILKLTKDRYLDKHKKLVAYIK